MSASRAPALNGTQHDYVNVDSIEITIRFSATLPDLTLSILPDRNATTSTLKQLIRASLPENLRNRRIRLIHAGKALVDDALLSTSLKLPLSRTQSRVPTPAPPPPHDPHDGRGQNSSVGSGGISGAKSKGKEIVRDPPTQSKIYIHCSIGDVVLSAAELATEVSLANKQSEAKGERNQSIEDGHHGQVEGQDEAWATTTRAPRGFDRLLSAGFTPAEVHSLRLQFMAIQAHTHTPDTMPSPEELRMLEDRWLDNSNNAGEPHGPGARGAGGLSDDDAMAGWLDDTLYGAAMGFFWPVGCLFWGMREEGVWSQRTKMAIAMGVVLNVGIGLIRWTS